MRLAPLLLALASAALLATPSLADSSWGRICELEGRELVCFEVVWPDERRREPPLRRAPPRLERPDEPHSPWIRERHAPRSPWWMDPERRR